MKYLDTSKNQLKNSNKWNFNEITRLLGLPFKSDNIIKSNAMKFIAKNICLITSKNGNLFCHKNSSVIKTKENGLVLCAIDNCTTSGKSFTILIIFEMISLKWIISSTNFYWLSTDFRSTFKIVRIYL